MSDCDNSSASDFDQDNVRNSYSHRKLCSKNRATYGVFISSDSSDENDLMYSRKTKRNRETDFQKPVNFVSGGINDKDGDSAENDIADIGIISDDSDDMIRNRKRLSDDKIITENKRHKSSKFSFKLLKKFMYR